MQLISLLLYKINLRKVQFPLHPMGGGGCFDGVHIRTKQKFYFFERGAGKRKQGL
jgi:hypothetical protein